MHIYRCRQSGGSTSKLWTLSLSSGNVPLWNSCRLLTNAHRPPSFFHVWILAHAVCTLLGPRSRWSLLVPHCLLPPPFTQMSLRLLRSCNSFHILSFPLSVVRKLQEFELPYVSITSLQSSEFHILLRKRYQPPARNITKHHFIIHKLLSSTFRVDEIHCREFLLSCRAAGSDLFWCTILEWHCGHFIRCTIQYNTLATNPTHVKLIVFSFCWRCVRGVDDALW